MGKLTDSEESIKKCSKCHFKTTSETEMHAHILDQRNKCGAQFYTDSALT